MDHTNVNETATPQQDTDSRQPNIDPSLADVSVDESDLACFSLVIKVLAADRKDYSTRTYFIFLTNCSKSSFVSLFLSYVCIISPSCSSRTL
jgi:hypothetical protein